MFATILDNTRRIRPIIHCITNYVSAHDCANLLLACGASPIMADCIEEVEEITSHAQALVLNTGTLNEQKLASMIEAGKCANTLGIPVILDPVGVGASRFRKEAVKKLLDTIHFTVIRGNASEIETLSTFETVSYGIDTVPTKGHTTSCVVPIRQAQYLSNQKDTIFVISGQTDWIIKQDTIYQVFNGHPCLTELTGTGCMLTSLIGAYCGAHPDVPLEATIAAVGVMGLCGELAHTKLTQLQGGTGALHRLLLDEISLLTPKQLEGGLRYALFQGMS